MMTGDGKKFGMWHGNQLFTRNTADMFLCSWSAVMLVNCFAKKVDWIKLSLAVLFSTRSPCFSAQKITVTVKDCNHPPRRILTKCRKKEGTWSAAGLQVPWPQNDAELVERYLRLDLQLWSCVCKIFQVSCMFGQAELRQAETALIFPSSHVWKIGAFRSPSPINFFALGILPRRSRCKKKSSIRFAHNPFAVWKMATYHALTFSSFGCSLFFFGSGTVVLSASWKNRTQNQVM